MSEVSEGQIQTASLDHLGLVAAICQDLKIAQKIDNRLPCDCQRKVSPGIAVVAMILNGLGFTNRRLYLTDQFFESKGNSSLPCRERTGQGQGHVYGHVGERKRASGFFYT